MAVKNSCPLCLVDVDRARWVDLAAVLDDAAPCEVCCEKIEHRALREHVIEIRQRPAPRIIGERLVAEAPGWSLIPPR